MVGNAFSSIRPGARHFTFAIVLAQVLTQIGAFTLPALLPDFIVRWSLSNTEAGWLVGVFFAAYVPAVPVLLALTDRLPTRRIYLLGTGCTALAHLGFACFADGFWSALAFRALAGFGWAGAYMPGLKAIADRLEGAAQSRAVSWHALGVGMAGSLSFAVAAGLNALAGPQAAFLFGGVTAAVACGIGALVLPREAPKRAGGGKLLDFRPVLRNRRAMAWITGYTVHTWELSALRAWGVTFLALAIARNGAAEWLPAAPVLFTACNLACILVSITGNELAQKLGRERVVLAAMLAAATLSVLTGWSIGGPPLLAVAAVLLWNASIYIDSSALTAGTVGAAEKEWRGATMGLHSMAGYAGGFVGPLGVGLALDWLGDGPLGWGVGFGHLAMVTLAGLFMLRRVARAG